MLKLQVLTLIHKWHQTAQVVIDHFLNEPDTTRHPFPCKVAYAWSKDGTRGHYQSRYQRGLVTHTHSNNSIELPGKAHSVLPLQWMEPLCAPCVLYALLFRNISEGVCCLVYISTFSLLTPVNKPKDKLQQQQKAIRGNKIAVAESSSSSSIAGAEGASQSRNQNHQQDGLWIFS